MKMRNHMISKDLLTSLVRTITPIIVGAAASIGLSLDDSAVAVIVLQILAYAIPRLLEAVDSRAGWLLGWAKQPQYDVGYIVD